MQLLGIILALVLLSYACFKGLSPLWTAPICAIIVAATNGLEVFNSFAGTFMQGFADFSRDYLMVFLLGGVFGKMMEVTGAAAAVGEVVVKLVGKKRAILAVILACAIMTYGGISLFIVMFVIYPIAAAAFRESNIPRQLFPGAYAVGCYTFTMTGLPGSPQIQNLIPMEYFGTNAMAAPVLGIVCSILLFGAGVAWMTHREKVWARKGIGWTENPNDASLASGFEIPKMNKVLSFLPLITVVVVLNVFEMDATIALAAGIIVNMICGINQVKLRKLLDTVNEGAISSLPISLVTASVVGFGSVVKMTDSFNSLADSVFGLPVSPLLIVMIAVNILAGICGSASGGMSIALSVLGDRIIALSESTGIPLTVFHRITSLSSGGLDTLPPGAVALLNYCGCSFKESYIDIFVTSVITPILVSLIAIALASVGLVF
ncbi:GntP family permease [Blautia schinkii]|nr:GntP family permease [Blautia schinkii]